MFHIGYISFFSVGHSEGVKIKKHPNSDFDAILVSFLVIFLRFSLVLGRNWLYFLWRLHYLYLDRNYRTFRSNSIR